MRWSFFLSWMFRYFLVGLDGEEENKLGEI